MWWSIQRITSLQLISKFFESWPGRVATKSIFRVILEYYRKIDENLTEQSH